MGQQDFKLFSKRYNNANRIILDNQPHIGCISIMCEALNCFLVSYPNSILIYDCETLKPINRIYVEIEFKKEGQQNKVLNIKFSRN